MNRLNCYMQVMHLSSYTYFSVSFFNNKILRFTSLIFLFSLLVLLSGCNSNKAQTGIREFKIDKHSINEFQNYIQTVYSSYPIPGLAISIIKDSQFYYHTIGDKIFGNNNPINANTSWFTGNFSELMVATAIMKLSTDGKIKLDDPVVKHLPYFKLNSPNYTRITIKHLLTHTSGVPYHDVIWDLPNLDEKALEMTTRSVNDQQPEIEQPGTSVKRTPYNYDILADLISKVSGMKFESYMQKNIFDPLQLKNSYFTVKNDSTANKVEPHHINDWLSYSISKDSLYPYNPEHAGSIGWHASISDLTRWMQMLLDKGNIKNGRFLSAEAAEELLKIQFNTGNNTAVGTGWEIEKTGDRSVFKKQFAIGGFSGALQMIPQEKTAVIVISNIAGDFNPHYINQQLVSWIYGKPLVNAKTPVSIAMGKKYITTKVLDSSLHLFHDLKNNSEFDCSPQALGQFGVNLLYRLHEIDKAILVFEFGAAQYPNSALAQLDLAEGWLVKGDIGKAKQALTKAKELKEKDKETASRLAYVEALLNKKTQS